MIFTNKKKNPSPSSTNITEKEYFTQQLVENNYRNRFWITVITMITFLVLIAGIAFAMFNNTAVSSEWKEILLLMLGVFTGSYNQIVSFWFNNSEMQKKMLDLAEKEDDLEVNVNTSDEKLLKG